jgi:hypothetical protein
MPRSPVVFPSLDPRRILSSAPILGTSVRAALQWGAQHTGLPVILVGAIAIVVSWRAFKRSVRFVVEVVVAVALLAVATRFGWIRW